MLARGDHLFHTSSTTMEQETVTELVICAETFSHGGKIKIRVLCLNGGLSHERLSALTKDDCIILNFIKYHILND